MGQYSSWSYTSTLTFWPVTTDKYGQDVAGQPYSLRGTHTVGGPAIRSGTQIEFVPNSTYYCEGEASQQPQRQWYVAVGEFTGTPPDDAEIIEKVQAYDVSQFESGSLVDFVVMT